MLFVLLMIFQPMLEPAGMLGEQDALSTAGRAAVPDMAVMGITATDGGSVEQGGMNYLAVNSHTIRVDIENLGALAGQSTLSLHYYSSAAAIAVLVGSVAVDLDPFEQESHTFNHPILVTGADQRFAATLTDAGEGDLTNNFNDLDFTVQTVEDGDNLGDSLPPMSAPPYRVGLGSLTYEATVRNAGNVPIQVDSR